MFRKATSSTPMEQGPARITPQNVASLRVAWRAPLPAEAGAVAAADGVVIAVTSNAKDTSAEVAAFASDCGSGGATCGPLWTARIARAGVMPDGPVIADGMVFVGAGDLYAFPLGCRNDGGSCPPAWTGGIASGGATQPVIDDTSVYVASNAGRVYAFPRACGTGNTACAPTWTSPSVGLPLLASAVADGRLYVSVQADEHTPHLNRIHGFSTTCATPCRPLRTWDVRGQVFASMPVVADGVIYVGTAVDGGMGSILAYDASCGIGKACRLWGVGERAALNIPVVGDGTVVIAARLGSHVIRAYPAGASGPRDPVWSACCTYDITDSIPAVADGLVYVASRSAGIAAYPLDCRPQGALCRPAWSWGPGYPDSTLSGDRGVLAVAVADGKLITAQSGGGLVAFAPAPARPALTAGDRRSAAAFYLGLAALGLGALAVRWRHDRRLPR